MIQLIGIAYSPFTEKAKWALDAYHVSYKYIEHTLLLSMPELHFRMRTLKPLTVPALIDSENNTRLIDSYEIAKYITQKFKDSPKNIKKVDLFSKPDLVYKLHLLSEKALDAGRALYAIRIRENKKAKIENLPPFIPLVLRPLATPVVDLGITYVLRAFDAHQKNIDVHRQTLRETLQEICNELGSKLNEKKPILESFSFADICICASLQFIAPVEDSYIKLGPASRECATDTNIKNEFNKLVAWRDTIYSQYRKS